ncbi:MAG: 5'-methylthioadenosine/S-adenosylhomocysteine nucleosidase [Coxiellaceae bacterium]|nr:5'-methylthioadenosine/S-adenosylhomocysteine nucleosidase [Coxiellaceae bacterium]
MRNIDIGIVCAVNEEYIALTMHLTATEELRIGNKAITIGTYDKATIAIIKSGIGNINSASATTLLYSTYHPQLMLFSGIAGSLNPTLNIGDVLIGSAAFQAEANSHEQLRRTWEMPPLIKTSDKRLHQIALSIAPNCPYIVRKGIIVSSDTYPAPDNFQSLFDEQHAQAIDMETAAFYQTCNGYNVPCLCIRSFSNPVTNSKREDLHETHIEKSSTHSSDFCFRIINTLVADNYLAQFISPKKDKVKKLISELNLQPHPEGGHYCRSYRSQSQVTVSLKEYGSNKRRASTSIYYLLNNHDFSAWHMVASDETWYHHQGCSITIHMINPTSREYNTACVGSMALDGSARPQYTVERNTWFAVSLNEPSSFALCGCAVSPGFEFNDFKLADRHSLSTLFPEHHNIIQKFTKEPTTSEHKKVKKNHQTKRLLKFSILGSVIAVSLLIHSRRSSTNEPSIRLK